MITYADFKVSPGTTSNKAHGTRQRLAQLLFGILGIGALAFATGCQEPVVIPAGEKVGAKASASTVAEELTMHEGDVLKIAFPGTAQLDSTQTVRRDGRITLAIVGEVKAAGLTPAALEKQLVQLYSSQLVSKEVTVTVVSSNFTVFVTGAVMRPGKIVSDHPLTALEAIMEAGGYDRTKADLKALSIIRTEDGLTKTFTLNIKDVLEGKQNDTFYLKPFDKLILPEKFSWF